MCSRTIQLSLRKQCLVVRPVLCPMLGVDYLVLENNNTSLTINHTVTSFNCTNLSVFYGNAASALSQICVHFPNLVSLKASEVTNEGLVSISKHCPLLQKVAILVAEPIEEGSATKAARNWPHLRKLSVHLTMDDVLNFS